MLMQTLYAIFEDGVLKPAQPLSLPPHAHVRLTLEVLEESDTNQPNPVSKIYEIMSRQHASGCADTAERHNEHQP
jgi:predicted DNA-binding antitoxin AbrB/MazE fold protein